MFRGILFRLSIADHADCSGETKHEHKVGRCEGEFGPSDISFAPKRGYLGLVKC